jgi:hypothetical protein
MDNQKIPGTYEKAWLRRFFIDDNHEIHRETWGFFT